MVLVNTNISVYSKIPLWLRTPLRKARRVREIWEWCGETVWGTNRCWIIKVITDDELCPWTVYMHTVHHTVSWKQCRTLVGCVCVCLWSVCESMRTIDVVVCYLETKLFITTDCGNVSVEMGKNWKPKNKSLFETIKRKLNRRLIYECWCDERLKSKVEGS